MPILFCRYLQFLIVCLLVVACAPARWEAPLDKQAELVWPLPPDKARVRYLGQLSSFVQTGESLRTKIFGKDQAGGRIVNPVAVAVGADNRIAIADLKRRGVHFFIPAEQKYLFLGSFGSEDMLSPVSVTFDGNMRLYVSDSVHAKILVFDLAGKFVREIAAGGSTKFKRPTGLVYQEQHDMLYVVDTQAHMVHIFNGEGNYQQSFGQRGIQSGYFNFPTHIATDRLGRLYVNDAMNFRVQVFLPPDQFFSEFGHHGDGSGDFAMPKGLAVDGDGNIYVAETLFDVVQVFNLTSQYLMSVGAKGRGQGEFWMPSGVFIDRADRLYVCDTYNNRIQLFQIVDENAGGGE